MSAWRYNVSFAMGVLLMLHVVHCTVGYWSSTQATMYRSLLGGYMSSARYIPISTVINLPGLNFDTCYVSHGEEKFCHGRVIFGMERPAISIGRVTFAFQGAMAVLHDIYG